MATLINRLEPYPLESLSSLLERLRRANYYEEVAWYTTVLPLGLDTHVNYLQDEHQYAAFAALTGLSVEQLYACTIHRLLPAFTLVSPIVRHTAARDSQRVFWEKAQQDQYIHGSRSRKLCPLCWAEQQIFLLPWLVRFVTVCPIHQVLLVDQCGVCHTPLRIDAVAGCCRRCRTPIAMLPTIALDGHASSRDLARMVWAALVETDAPFPPPGLPIADDHPLAGMAPATFLTFLWQGFLLLTIYDPTSPLFHADLLPPGMGWERPAKGLRNATVMQVHGALVGMWRLLWHWPEPWYTTLERIATTMTDSLHSQPFVAALADRFSGAQWRWLHTGWANFIRAEMHHNPAVVPWLRYYRGMRGTMLPETTPPLLSQREAAQTLGVSEEQLQHFVAQGQLRTTASPLRPSQRPWQLIEAESVNQLRLARATHLTLAQTAERVGTSAEQVVALVRAGLLDAVSGPLVDERALWRFDPVVIAACLEHLLGQLPVRPPTVHDQRMARYFPYLQRVAIGAYRRLPQLLLDIQREILPAARLADTVSLTVVWCNAIDVMRYVGMVRRERRAPCSVNAVCERLGCKPTTLRRLYGAGLLIPITDETDLKGARHQYDEADVAVFLERYITSDEAAFLLGVTQLTVQGWARAGRIQAVTGPEIDGSHAYRFEKAALAQWRHERLTFGEAMTLLDVSKATLDRWAKQGRLTPLADMDGKQRLFARADVERLRDG